MIVLQWRFIRSYTCTALYSIHDARVRHYTVYMMHVYEVGMFTILNTNIVCNYRTNTGIIVKG